MVRGVCAGDARQISAASFVAGPLFRMEQEDGGVFRSVIKGALGRKKKVEHSEAESCDLVKKARSERWSVWTLEGGLETLVSALEERLTKEEGVEIRKDSPVRELSSKDGSVLLSSGNDLGGSFDGVFLTCPAPKSAPLLSGEASVALSSIPFVTVAVVTVEFDSDHLPGVPDAFGFLVPSSQPELILGVVFDTCSFPQPGKSVFTVMLGGQWFKVGLNAFSFNKHSHLSLLFMFKLLYISDVLFNLKVIPHPCRSSSPPRLLLTSNPWPSAS